MSVSIRFLASEEPASSLFSRFNENGCGRDLMALHPEDKWGKGIVKQFALDMRSAFPNETGFSDTNIKYMRHWFEFYTQSAAIGQQAADQMEMPVSFGRIPWFHHVLIFTKSATVDEAFFYIQQTIAGNWSRRLLEDNMGAPGNRFLADLYSTHFTCNGVEYAVGCGALSPQDANMVNRAGVSGVIGKDFFDRHIIAIRNDAVYASN